MQSLTTLLVQNVFTYVLLIFYSQDNVRAKDELQDQKEAQLATSLLQQQQSGEETVQVVSCLVMCLCVTSSMKAPWCIILGACVSVVHCQLETINTIVHRSNLSRKLCALI